MKRNAKPIRPIPLHDYSPALQSAVSWLGERYVLAEPVTRRREERKAYFNTPREWMRASQGNVLTRTRRLAH